jgi:hypothetical protein
MPIFKVGQLVRDAVPHSELGTGIITRLWSHKFRDGGKPGADVRFFGLGNRPMPVYLHYLEPLEAK